MAERAHRKNTLRICTAVAATCATILGFGCGEDGGGVPEISGSLAFFDSPASGVAFATLDSGAPAAPITVEILDEEGVRVPDATDEVTLRIEASPGYLILHGSGLANPNTSDNTGRMLELVDPAIPAVRHWLEKNWRLDAPTSLAYDAETDEYLLTNRRIHNFYRGDPRTGEATLVGNGTTDWIAGMAWEVPEDPETTPRLFAVVNKNAAPEDALYTIDPTSGIKAQVGLITPDMANLNFFSGLAIDPVDGTVYASAAMNDNPDPEMPFTGRILMTIDPESDDLDATIIDDMGELNAGLAMGPDQQLYLVQTGKSDPVPGPPDRKPDLMTVDKATAAASFLIKLENGADGNAITAVPARLHGMVTVAAVDGVATFDDLMIDAIGTGYTLTAEAVSRASTTSPVFDVTTLPVAPTYVVSFDISGSDGVEEMVPFFNVDETDPSFDVTVTLDSGTALTDVYVTAGVNGTAADANAEAPDTDLDYLDYFQFVIPQGASTATRTVTLVDDDEVEDEETITFHLKDASLAAGIGTDDKIQVNITSEDVEPPEEP